jgi:hypothetical protein
VFGFGRRGVEGLGRMTGRRRANAAAVQNKERLCRVSETRRGPGIGSARVRIVDRGPVKRCSVESHFGGVLRATGHRLQLRMCCPASLVTGLAVREREECLRRMVARERERME